ncbi:MAG: Gfo/Idh/MocA family oxidoreductase [Anaerolineales bacterium]
MPSEPYGHTPARQALELGDVYGLAFDEARAARPPVRLGLVGAGGVVQSKHLPAIWRLRTLWEPVTVEAIVEPNEQVGRKVAALYGCRWYAGLPAMLAAEKLDAVIVAAPDEQHYPAALSALEHNLHVLVEKPITRSLVQAEHLCRLAAERGRVLVTVANKRFSPPYRRARRLIAEGPVSDPALFVGKFNLGYDYVWLLESGTIHLFDLARFLMGPVARLQAVGVDKYHRNRAGYPLDNLAATLEFTSGAVGGLTTSATALSFKPWERVEVYGNKRWLAVEDQYELILYDDEEGPAQHWRPAMPNTLLFDEEFGGYTGMIENFLQAVRGFEPPGATGWDGYRTYEMAVAAHLSILRRAAVSLPLAAEAADAELAEALRPA